jgi:hypothetical protein
MQNALDLIPNMDDNMSVRVDAVPAPRGKSGARKEKENEKRTRNRGKLW